MPAKSKQQQKFMGIVRAIQKGDEPASKFSKDAQDAADDMKKKDVEDFASTKHKGLPKKVEQYLRQQIRKSVKELLKKEDYVETCGYTQSVDGKKLKTPGGTGEEDRELKEGLPTKIKDLKKVKKVKPEPDSQKGTFDSIETFTKHHAGSMGAGDMGRIAEPDTYDWDDSGSETNPAGHQTKKNKKKKGWEPVEESSKMRGARGLVKVPNEYVGKLGRVQYNLMKKLGYTRGGTHLIIADMHWGRNSRHRMTPNNQWSASILLKTHPYKKTKTGGYEESDLLKGDVKKVLVELMRQLRANKLRLDGKPKITGSTRYMPQIEFRVKPEQFKESVNENTSYKVGDTISYWTIGRIDKGKAKVKGVTKARPNRLGIKNHYITNKGTFSDMEVVGTEAYKLRFKGNTEKKVMKAMGLESVNEDVYIGFYKNKQVRVKARSDKHASKQIISKLRIPKRDKDIASLLNLTKNKRNIQKFESMNPRAIKKMRDEFKKTGDLPPHLKKFALDLKILKKKHKVKNIVVPGLEWMSDMKEQSVNEARLDPKQLLKQLGGNRFIMMVGAKNLAVDKSRNELHMKIGRNSKGVSHVVIKLNAKDLYDMKFLQMRKFKIKIKSKVKDVYADQLGKMFKKHTGMNVRL